jgi:PqqD family protein of HPr-rel-A system
VSVAQHPILYTAESADQLLVEPLDAITLIYQRRSGITHMVAEPVPEILAVMGSDAVDSATVVARLAASFDLGDDDDAIETVTARLEELADLGLVQRASCSA